MSGPNESSGKESTNNGVLCAQPDQAWHPNDPTAPERAGRRGGVEWAQPWKRRGLFLQYHIGVGTVLVERHLQGRVKVI